MPLDIAFDPPLFFDENDLWRVLIATPILYIAAIAFIRISGKRSTSQMNNFDWIVTVAMGTMVASPILLDEVVILEAAVAIALLLLLQYAVTKISVHSSSFERIVKARPMIVVRDGAFVREAMHAERITEAEIEAAIRENGLADLRDAAMVVLESDASLSVLRNTPPAQSDRGSNEWSRLER